MPYASDGHDSPAYIHGEKRRRQFSHVWNSAYAAAIKEGLSPKDAEARAFREANGVVGKTAQKSFENLLDKSAKSEARAFADALIAAMEKEYKTLPAEVREPLANARLSGVGEAMLSIDVSNHALLSGAKSSAEEYAFERAAELVGMRYDEEGNLIENPDAKWAISDTTRDRINEIIADAFSEDLSLSEIKDAIQEALEEETTGSGIFSAARAQMIARTEITNAQAGGNYSVWWESGVVKRLTWTTSEDSDVCPTCDDNDGVTVEIGKPFPSGDLFPGAHPNCRCVVVVAETA